MNFNRLSLIVLTLITLSCNQATGSLMVSTETPVSVINPAGTATPVKDANAQVQPVATVFTTPALYVPPSCQDMQNTTTPFATIAAEPTPEPKDNPPINREEQLRVFNELARIISETYLYPDFNGVDWPGIVAQYRSKVENELDTETFYAQMGEFVKELGDEHSHFESPAQVAASEDKLAGKNDFVGIGVYIQPLLEKGHGTILVVFPDSSAEHSGLKPHDSILAVDGLPLIDNGIPYPERLLGPECSAVVLTVQSPGEAQRDLTLLRYRVTSPIPIAAELVPAIDGSHIGYIFLPTFFDKTIPDQVEMALTNFGSLDGLILDNRMNGGGSGKVMESILSYFTAGRLGQFTSRTDTRDLDILANSVNSSQTVPLVVLVGKDTVSFGEIFSGVLQDTGRAKIVGETTLGNVETLHSYKFEDGSVVWIAQERFDPAQTHSDWEKDGVIPDMEAYAEWDSFTFENDPSVAAAMELLGHK